MGRKYKKRKTSKDEKSQVEQPPPSPPSLDRISALPDAMLDDILTLLPTKTAVSTSVLSNRWRSLWTHLTSLHLDFRQFPQNSPEFYPIVDHLLSRLTAPCLYTFSLHAPFPTHQHLESWFRRLSARNIQNMKIDIDFSDSNLDSPLTMPLCIFQTRSLVSLDFSPFRLHYDLPDDTLVDIQLPNLTKLRLSLSASECGFVSKLVSSCPSLEDLFLTAAGNWPPQNDENGVVVVIDISSASLKGLQFNFFAASENVNIMIDAPNLDLFGLYAFKLKCWFVKKPVALREASIMSISQTLLSPLVPVISAVTVLRILAVTICLFDYFKDDQGKSLVFRNLTELKLQLCTEADGLDAFPFDSPPPRLLLRVKTIQVIMYNVKTGKNLKKLADYFLSKAPDLERIIFNVLPHSSQSEDERQYMLDEMEVCMDLSLCSLISPKCVIEFYGLYAKLPATNAELQLMDTHVRILRAYQSLIGIVRSL